MTSGVLIVVSNDGRIAIPSRFLYKGFSLDTNPVAVIDLKDALRWKALLREKLSVPTPALPDDTVIDMKRPDPAIAALGFRSLKEYKSNAHIYSLGHNFKTLFLNGPAKWTGNQWLMEKETSLKLAMENDSMLEKIDEAIENLTFRIGEMA